MRMDFLYQADENYAVYGGASITSLFENNKDAISCFCRNFYHKR